MSGSRRLAPFSFPRPFGEYSALAANGNLCKSKLAMPTEFLAQKLTGELYSRQRSNRYLADELVSPSNAWSLTPLGDQVTQQIALSASNAERTP
jgi:hypothetical protein